MDTKEGQLILLAIVLLPLIGAIANGVLSFRKAQNKWVTIVGVGTVAASFVLAVIGFGMLVSMRSPDIQNPALVYHFYEWFSLSLPGGKTVPVNVRFIMDSLSSMMTLVVTGIGGLIHLYADGDIADDKGYARYFSYLNLFTSSMLILVLASSVPLMFVGWEGVGLCSYLLIGFWFENRDYAAAGRKAFVANRIGDFGVLIAMFLMVMFASSFEFVDINAAATAGKFDGTLTNAAGNVHVASIATVVCLFVFLGCTGKSAQIPLFVWLPDAMAGPTPVSALIHAATMVTAGVYLCCRLSPLFMVSETAMAVIAITGTLTALLAATIAVVQNEMKRILAYSTVSQLGFMFAAVGVGFFSAGFFHVFTHAFFKACLFLGAGSVMHAVHAHGDADIRKLGGLRAIMPTTHWTFAVSCAAIAGVPLLSGFFSKDEILLGAATQALGEGSTGTQVVGWIVIVGLSLAAILTAFYMFRLYFLTFTGTYRSAGDSSEDHGYDSHPHESPTSMTLPLAVLGTGAVIGGFVGIPESWTFVPESLRNMWGHWLHTTVAGTHAEVHSAHTLTLVLGFAIPFIGIGLAWVLYYNKQSDSLPAKMPKRVYSFLFDKWRVDELYAATVIDPIKSVAVACGRVDQTFVDALMTRWPSFNVRTFGRWFAKLQSGVVQTYAMAMMIGLVLVLWWFAYPHPRVQAKIQGASIVLVASSGSGYEYRWDGDSDGEFEKGWTSSPSFSQKWTRGQPLRATLEVRNAFGNTAKKIVTVAP